MDGLEVGLDVDGGVHDVADVTNLDCLAVGAGDAVTLRGGGDDELQVRGAGGDAGQGEGRGVEHHGGVCGCVHAGEIGRCAEGGAAALDRFIL